MIPTIDERLASVMRSLSDIILPGLREDASLAREQAQLAIGHLAILRQQLDQAPGFEAKELEDIDSLARNLAMLDGAPDAARELQAEIDKNPGIDSVRDRVQHLNKAVSLFMKRAFDTGEQDLVAKVNKIVLTYGSKRAPLDRQWFAPMGFDGEILDKAEG